MFEPGVITAYCGAEIARWSINSGMDFIGTPGGVTQDAGYVLNLIFSNILFASSEVKEDMHNGLDHETQVTTIPRRGYAPLNQFHYRVPESELGKFSGLVKNNVTKLPDVWQLTNPNQINSFVKALIEVFTAAIQIAGKLDCGGGSPAS